MDVSPEVEGFRVAEAVEIRGDGGGAAGEGVAVEGGVRAGIGDVEGGGGGGVVVEGGVRVGGGEGEGEGGGGGEVAGEEGGVDSEVGKA